MVARTLSGSSSAIWSGVLNSLENADIKLGMLASSLHCVLAKEFRASQGVLQPSNGKLRSF